MSRRVGKMMSIPMVEDDEEGEGEGESAGGLVNDSLQAPRSSSRYADEFSDNNGEEDESLSPSVANSALPFNFTVADKSIGMDNSDGNEDPVAKMYRQAMSQQLSRAGSRGRGGGRILAIPRQLEPLFGYDARTIVRAIYFWNSAYEALDLLQHTAFYKYICTVKATASVEMSVLFDPIFPYNQIESEAASFHWDISLEHLFELIKDFDRQTDEYDDGEETQQDYGSYNSSSSSKGGNSLSSFYMQHSRTKDEEEEGDEETEERGVANSSGSKASTSHSGGPARPSFNNRPSFSSLYHRKSSPGSSFRSTSGVGIGPRTPLDNAASGRKPYPSVKKEGKRYSDRRSSSRASFKSYAAKTPNPKLVIYMQAYEKLAEEMRETSRMVQSLQEQLEESRQNELDLQNRLSAQNKQPSITNINIRGGREVDGRNASRHESLASLLIDSLGKEELTKRIRAYMLHQNSMRALKIISQPFEQLRLKGKVLKSSHLIGWEEQALAKLKPEKFEGAQPEHFYPREKPRRDFGMLVGEVKKQNQVGNFHGYLQKADSAVAALIVELSMGINKYCQFTSKDHSAPGAHIVYKSGEIEEIESTEPNYDYPLTYIPPPTMPTSFSTSAGLYDSGFDLLD